LRAALAAGRFSVRSGWEHTFVVKPKDRPGETRREIERLLRQGVRRSEIAKQVGVSRPTVTYHAKRLGFPSDRRFAVQYDWAEIRHAYDSGLSISECKDRFGFCSQTWYDAVERGDIVPRPSSMPIAELCVAGVRRGRRYLKQRLIDEGLRSGACEQCGIESWNGGSLETHLHHVNGDPLDNRLENLQLLCPNCHSQTPNYSGRNRGREAA
jgi:DNA-binding transcriptional ArsR family regulator